MGKDHSKQTGCASVAHWCLKLGGHEISSVLVGEITTLNFSEPTYELI